MKDDVAGAHSNVIVCVDDQPEILSALRRTLRNEPYEVWTTEDPRQALDWVASHGVSVLIADQRMPQLAGTALLAAVKERSPRTARIVLTGFPTDEPIRAVLDDSDDAIQFLIGKPWSDEGLRLSLRQILERQGSRA